MNRPQLTPIMASSLIMDRAEESFCQGGARLKRVPSAETASHTGKRSYSKRSGEGIPPASLL